MDPIPTERILANNWHAIRGLIPRQWSRLTEDDVREIGGRREALVGSIQKRYGFTREQSEGVVDDFLSIIHGF